ncbi:MAG TPA: cupin domain-containing protein [Terriglobales bacterium]|nr:cupin domain-containing protein [Terriglobales bacterium]
MSQNITRRNAIAHSALLMLAAAAGAAAQTPAPAQGRGPVFVHDLPDVTMKDWQVHVSYVDMAPGRVGKPHRHPGFVLAYVLKGAVVTKISGQDEKTYQVGEMFYEPPGSTHQVSRNASSTEPAQLLAMIFAPKGVPLTMPAPGE